MRTQDCHLPWHGYSGGAAGVPYRVTKGERPDEQLKVRCPPALTATLGQIPASGFARDVSGTSRVITGANQSVVSAYALWAVQNASADMSALIKECWRKEDRMRPTFRWDIITHIMYTATGAVFSYPSSDSLFLC